MRDYDTENISDLMNTTISSAEDLLGSLHVLKDNIGSTIPKNVIYRVRDIVDNLRELLEDYQ